MSDPAAERLQAVERDAIVRRRHHEVAVRQQQEEDAERRRVEEERQRTRIEREWEYEREADRAARGERDRY